MNLQAIWCFIVINFKRDFRYPIQAIPSLLFAIFVTIGMAFGASYTADIEGRIALLANMAMILSMATFSQVSSGLTEKNEAIEEKLFLPLTPSFFVASLACFKNFRLVLIFTIMYCLIHGFTTNLFLAFSLAIIEGLSLGLLLFSLRLLFIETDFLQTMVTLAVFSLAFLPLHKAPDWLFYIPIVSVIQAIQNSSLTTSFAFNLTIQLIIFALTLLFALWVDKEIVRRGIASDV